MLIDAREYITSLAFSPSRNGRMWAVLRNFTAPGARGVTVPRGFVTDFASVPRPLWWVIPPWGTHGPAAVVHDYLYWSQPRSREHADQVFRDIMAASDVPPIRMWVLYLGVRAVGWAAWNSNTRQREQGVSRHVRLT